MENIKNCLICGLLNVEIKGYVVGVLNQVGDATGNGDYTKLERCTINGVT